MKSEFVFYGGTPQELTCLAKILGAPARKHRVTVTAFSGYDWDCGRVRCIHMKAEGSSTAVRAFYDDLRSANPTTIFGDCRKFEHKDPADLDLQTLATINEGLRRFSASRFQLFQEIFRIF